MKHKNSTVPPVIPTKKSALGSLNAAFTAHLEYGGTLQAVTDCCSLPPSQPRGGSLKRIVANGLLHQRFFDVTIILSLRNFKVNRNKEEKFINIHKKLDIILLKVYY